MKKKYAERQMLFSKPLSEEANKWIKTTIEEDLRGNPYDLIKAMQKVIRRQVLAHPYETKMTVKELSLDERVVQIKKRLRDWKGR